MNKPYIELRNRNDFGDTINTYFLFLKYNFKEYTSLYLRYNAVSIILVIVASYLLVIGFMGFASRDFRFGMNNDGDHTIYLIAGAIVLILILFVGVKYIKPVFNNLTTTVFALLSFIFCFWLGYHVLMHLPVVDFRAYKIGNNISEGMSIPDDAPKPVVEYYWKFKINGEEKIITTNGSYPDVEGDYIGVETKVIDEGYQPPVVDFSIESDDEDLTQQFLSEENLIIIVSYNLEKMEKAGAEKLKVMSDEAIKKGYQVIGLTASGKEAKQQIKKQYHLNFDFYLCDEKALKTVVRSNPGILELDKGTIKQKVHWNDMDDLKL